MSESSQTRIEIFTDYVCPWCYLASAVVEKVEQTHHVDFQWSPFPLHPDTPDEGLLLESFLGPNLDAMHDKLYGLMDELGLEHCDRTKTYNSRLAQELGMWADTQENGKALHKELYRTYFVQDRNLALKTVLLDAVENASLDSAVAESVIDKREFSETVDASWMRARQMQISGVPSFIAGGYITSGYHPYDELVKFIEYVEIQDAIA
ncbi:MAG: DsbA family protein [Gammaproteobacteria bacterium]|nr:DsbA family protein [Gammaproteobacteria bacterium]